MSLLDKTYQIDGGKYEDFLLRRNLSRQGRANVACVDVSLLNWLTKSSRTFALDLAVVCLHQEIE